MIASQRSYPNTRLRRLRKHSFSRTMVQETSISCKDLVQPIFIVEGTGQKQPIETIPDTYRLSVDMAIEYAKEIYDDGIQAAALFPAIEPSLKDITGTEGTNPSGLVPRAISEFKKYLPDMGVIADVALDPYTSHGQDGIIDTSGYVLNDDTVLALAKQATVNANAGADIIAPSDMMDGRIQAIRNALDESSFHDVILLSYSAKYASSLYGPFRDAVNSGKALGKADKKTYQMDPANAHEALHEAACDLEEGADILMVKPAGLYLDIISTLKQEFKSPIAAYQVSGEYTMLKLAIEQGALAPTAIDESLLSIKRAGADIIFSYFAGAIARNLTK